jgi:hypothetical protein
LKEVLLKDLPQSTPEQLEDQHHTARLVVVLISGVQETRAET